jgi:ectoine hydroxylase
MLQRLFQQYTGYLRRLKAAYVFNNFLNADRLRHNRALYRRLGLRKSIFSPLGQADFKTAVSEERPWIDQPDALERMAQHRDFQHFDARIQAQIRQFITDGYMVLEHLLPDADIEALNAEVDTHLNSGKAQFNFTGRKIFNFWEQSPLADERFFRHPELLRVLSFLLGREVMPFQSLNFTLGSEQRVHSDSIHMTTQPEGYMIAAWMALEDCSLDNGPLVYYPGSHRLPFVTTQDYDSGNSFFALGADSNRRYEDKIEEILAAQTFEKKHFIAKKGDVLIWHSNLLHGGSPIQRAGATRRSMVCHYYAKDVICYHELSQRPALLPK